MLKQRRPHVPFLLSITSGCVLFWVLPLLGLLCHTMLLYPWNIWGEGQLQSGQLLVPGALAATAAFCAH